MNFLTTLGLVFVFGSFVQANTDVLDLNNQNIEYVAKSQTPNPEMLEEIFPEEYVKAHEGLKSNDEVQEEIGSIKVQEEVRQSTVSGGSKRDQRAVHTWMGVFLLFTFLP